MSRDSTDLQMPSASDGAPGPLVRLPPRVRMAAVFSVLGVLCVLNIRRAIHCGQLSGCVDPYWADFWLISYADGYERRALAGSLMRALHPGSISSLALNIVAFSIAASCLALFVYSIRSKITATNSLLPMAALALGPTVTTFFEALGDTLQLCFMATIAYLLVCRSLRGAAVFVVPVFVSLLVTMIHEASIFLFVPAIYWCHRASQGKQARLTWAAILILSCAALAVLLLNNQKPEQVGIPLVLNDASLHLPPENSLPSFLQLLNREFTYYSGAEGLQRFAYRAVGTLLWPVLMLLGWMYFFRDRNAARVFGYLLVLSLPLYPVARDWGRFAIFTLLLSLAISTWQSRGAYQTQPTSQAGAIPRIAGLAELLFSKPGFATVFPALFLAHQQYRVDGLTRHNTFHLGVGLVLILILSGIHDPAAAGQSVDPSRK